MDTLLHGFQAGPVKLPTGLLLAPMEGHTDSAFRRMVMALGGCGMTYSEMTTAPALLKGKVMERTALKIFTPVERPLAFQVTGCDASEVADAARRFAGLEPDFIDLNMGCPSNNAGSSGHGAALLKDLDNAVKVIEAVIAAVQPLPVTLKMRAGWDEDRIVMCELGKAAERAGVVMLVLHPRTRKQGYAGSAPWPRIGELKRTVAIPVVGCGDVVSPADAVRMRDETGCDGVMIGRGALMNPWIFRQTKELLETGRWREPTLAEKLAFLRDHLELQLRITPQPHKALGRAKGLAGQLTKGMERGALLRNRLNEVRGVDDFRRLVAEYEATVAA